MSCAHPLLQDSLTGGGTRLGTAPTGQTWADDPEGMEFDGVVGTWTEPLLRLGSGAGVQADRTTYQYLGGGSQGIQGRAQINLFDHQPAGTAHLTEFDFSFDLNYTAPPLPSEPGLFSAHVNYLSAATVDLYAPGGSGGTHLGGEARIVRAVISRFVEARTLDLADTNAYVSDVSALPPSDPGGEPPDSISFHFLFQIRASGSTSSINSVSSSTGGYGSDYQTLTLTIHNTQQRYPSADLTWEGWEIANILICPTNGPPDGPPDGGPGQPVRGNDAGVNPANLRQTQWGHHGKFSISGGVLFFGNDVAHPYPNWDHPGIIVATSTGTKSAHGLYDGRGIIYCLYDAKEGPDVGDGLGPGWIVKEARSTDDGQTWSATEFMFQTPANGTKIPRMLDDQAGHILRCAFALDAPDTTTTPPTLATTGRIIAVLQGPGERADDPDNPLQEFWFVDETDTQLHLADTGYDIIAPQEGSDRWYLCASVVGESGHTDFSSQDRGRHWRRMTLQTRPA